MESVQSTSYKNIYNNPTSKHRNSSKSIGGENKYPSKISPVSSGTAVDKNIPSYT